MTIMNIDPQFLRAYTVSDLNNNAFGISFLTEILKFQLSLQEAVMVVLESTNRAPTALFIEFAKSDPLYAACTSAAAYQSLLVTKNAVHFQCERIFEAHNLQNIYSAVLVQASAGSFLDDAMNLGTETELESLISGILNNTTIIGE